jgi:hypothetical protein
MTIIRPWAKAENSTIAVPSGMTAVAKTIAVINTEPIAVGIVAEPLAGAAIASDRRIDFRVEIHTGNVVVEDGGGPMPIR